MNRNIFNNFNIRSIKIDYNIIYLCAPTMFNTSHTPHIKYYNDKLLGNINENKIYSLYNEYSYDKVLYDTDNPYKSGVRKGQPRVRNVMQGDRIEHIDYITEKDLDLDYEFYITNQIMNPVKQVLDLGMDSENTDKLFLQ